ncbi:cobalt/nickel transport system permease protein [Nicoletella semolina]|uniref:Cobalt/nickel transport system permease protein n=1 Tax=Nicoletella semolina TaxID=271160 RepID=A0A4R2NBL8_9PAST|nr:energy-coupling factor transporter transmembrane component T [Nicoletella semolina]TCP18460.1 cobalt/nickel transport system permease protein [Nicoletella semolina]
MKIASFLRRNDLLGRSGLSGHSGLLAPHWRLVYLFLWGILVSAIQHVDILVGLNSLVMFILLLLLTYHGKPLKQYLKRWCQFHFFTLGVWLTLSWKMESNGIICYANGVHLATLISLRMNLILCSSWLLLLNVNDTLLLQAVKRLPLPIKFQHLFVLTVRYIALFSELNTKMELAMKARGYQAKCNFRTIKMTVQRVALLLIHALLKVEQSERALKARGFQPLSYCAHRQTSTNRKRT